MLAMKKSTTDSSEALKQPLIRADHADINRVRFPDLADMMARLHFSTSDGRIWLDEQRMLLVHARALGSLRREMIETLGELVQVLPASHMPVEA